jgi:Ca2+-binding RTX toxin-like protein
MTIVNASAATEAVFMTLVSDQVTFAGRDPGGFNSGTTSYSWLTTGGDDVQVTGTGIDTAGSPPASGLASLIEIDLSNNDFSDPDVVISSITRPNAFGAPFTTARMSVITASAQDFFNEILALDDTMTGSAFGDTFKAGGGADTLNMGSGNDTAYGGDGDDTINGDAGDDRLFGEAGDDELNGGSGADTLNGGTGADDMDGGTGNDVYVVDNAGDTASEAFVLFGGGVDRVDASVSHTLSANIENLTLTGAAATSGTGNALANVINGNGASNTLRGLAGNDTISGGGGNDFIDGGTGADAMDGGAGNDVFVVDNVGDTVVDAAGIDTVRSSITWGLGATIENLTLTGAAAINGTGNGLANTIIGNAAANILLGLGGNDVIRGGGGADTISGDAGADVFDYDFVTDSGPAAAARDVIMGFDAPGGAVVDVINLATIDANVGVAGNQAFAFLGWIQAPNPPATPAGSIWLRNEAGETVVYANVDANAAPEMAIRIADGPGVTAAMYDAFDFVL